MSLLTEALQESIGDLEEKLAQSLEKEDWADAFHACRSLLDASLLTEGGERALMWWEQARSLLDKVYSDERSAKLILDLVKFFNPEEDNADEMLEQLSWAAWFYEGEEDWEGLGNVLLASATVLSYWEECWEEAWDRSNDAVQFVRDAGLPAVLSRALRGRAVLEQKLGRLEVAESSLKEAIEVAKQIADPDLRQRASQRAEARLLMLAVEQGADFEELFKQVRRYATASPLSLKAALGALPGLHKMMSNVAEAHGEDTVSLQELEDIVGEFASDSEAEKLEH